MIKTHSKTMAILIVTLLALSTISAIIPLGFTTVTSRPTLYEYGTNTTYDPLLVEAGGNVSINMDLMTVTGAQVWLWISNHGGSELNWALGDRPYAGPFLLSEVSDPVGIYNKVFTPSDLTALGAPFDAENRDYQYTYGNRWINGTVPLQIQGDDVDYWIKVADVNVAPVIAGTELGVSNNRINFTPGFYATPLMGAPETEVTVSGYALPAAELYNVTEDGMLVLELLGSTTHNASGWLWTGFSDTFNIYDLEENVTNPLTPPQSDDIDIDIIENSTATTLDTFVFVEYFRELYLEGTFYGDGIDVSGSVTLNTGDDYDIDIVYFPAFGSVDIYLGTNLIAFGQVLNGTGGKMTTVTIPAVDTGDYVLSVLDNNGVMYNITVNVFMSPFISVTPESGNVGDSITVTGGDFLDYVGDYVTIYFENNDDSPYYVMLANFTVPSPSWSIPLVVPQSMGGEMAVEARIIDGTTVIADDTFMVLAKLVVVPGEIDNDCSLVSVIGTGLEVWDDYTSYRKTYAINIDNQFMGAAGSMYRAHGGVSANSTGSLIFEFLAAGFRPGRHVVSIYGDSRGSYVDGDIVSYSPAAYTCFNVSTVGDLIVDALNLTAINAQLTTITGNIATLTTDVGTIQVDLAAVDAKVTSIQGSVATISTTIGSLQSSVSALSGLGAIVTGLDGDIATIQTTLGDVVTWLTSIDATITSIDGDVATVQTSLGTVQTSLTSINTKVTSIDGDVATVQTSLGTLEGKVTAIEGTLATIETDLGNVEVDLGTLQTEVAGVTDTVNEGLPIDMLPIWIGVVLALIAAIAAIAAVFIIQRKIAG